MAPGGEPSRQPQHPGGGPGGREPAARTEPGLPCREPCSGRQAEGPLTPLRRRRAAHPRSLWAGQEASGPLLFAGSRVPSPLILSSRDASPPRSQTLRLGGYKPPRRASAGLCKKQKWGEGWHQHPKTSQEQVGVKRQPHAGTWPFASQDACVTPGPGRRYTFTLHAGREGWPGAKQCQGREWGPAVSKPRCAYASLGTRPWRCPGCHAGLGDATTPVQMPPSHFAGSGASNPSWGELVWVWLVNATPPAVLHPGAGGNKHGELELIQVTTFRPSAGIRRFPRQG